MGLIKKNYEIKQYGVTLDSVYAKIVVLTSEFEGKSVATLQIKKNKEDFEDRTIQPIKQVSLQFDANKNIPLWKQGYDRAKESEEFLGWIDDLIE